MATKNGITLIVVLALCGQSAVAEPTEVYRATADLTTLQTHGLKPHLHTRAQEPPNWQTMARLWLGDVSLGDVWNVLVEGGIRYHGGPLSFSARVIACNQPCGNTLIGPGEFTVIRSAVIHLPAGSKYDPYARHIHWIVPDGVAEDMYVELQVRLLSLPIGSRQGQKVYFYPPSGQVLSIAVHK